MTNEEAIKALKRIRNEAIDNFIGEWQDYEAFGIALKALADRKTESNSEIPNNCEHITEDGVTCAKYPACDDCLDNPLNKVKGSERLVKGKDEPQTICKECVKYPCESWQKGIITDKHNLVECRSFEPKDEPQTVRSNLEPFRVDEPQTDCAWK